MAFQKHKINPGDKFGRLTIIEISHRDRYSKIYYKTLCDCGKKHIANRCHLLNGGIKSCGCLFTELKSREKGLAAFNKIFRSYKFQARKRNLPFELNLDSFKIIIVKNCFYCNSKPNSFNPYLKRNGKKQDNRVTKKFIDRAWINCNGIDRKDNTLGYTEKNCVPSCYICNWMKLDLGYQNFINHIEKIHRTLFKVPKSEDLQDGISLK